ncbi:MAG: hypothetical protein IPJ34_03540 [Myxococcales bacterium]|nr:hypothetical protein [Myxococcales bacterium]
MALKSSSIAAVLSSLTVGVVASWAPSLWAQAAPAPAPAPAAAPTTAPAAAPTTAPATKGTGSLPGGLPDLGEKGAFVIDQVSGFRGRIGGGVGYYGPVGVAYNTFTGVSGVAVSIGPDGKPTTISQNERTIRSWSIWLAPSIDYFLVDNLSIGGLFSIETTFGSQTNKVKQIVSGTSAETENDLPTVVSFTLMPRIGYLIRTSDRLSIWPRIGVGYFNGRNGAVETSTDTTTGKTTSQTVTTSISSMLFQLDLGIIYQVTDNVFFRVAPGVAFSTNGSSTVRYKGAYDKEGVGQRLGVPVRDQLGLRRQLLPLE